jgi:hypothetical protein
MLGEGSHQQEGEMRNFLLYLAGARRDILDMTPTERPKFLVLGLSILLDGVFIGVVAALAFIPAGVHVALASAFGCLIGLLFVTLDMRLVAPTERGRKILAAAPRVLLALLCAAIFSMAIAIGSLSPEIDQQIAVIKQRTQAEFSQQQSASALDKEISVRQNELNNLNSIIATDGGTTLNPATDPELRSLENQLKSAQAAEATAFENWQCQLYGISANGSKCKPGAGPLAQVDQSQYEMDTSRVTSLEAQIASREQQLTSSGASAQAARVSAARTQLPGVKLELEGDQQTLAAENANFTAANNSDNGLLRQVQALGELIGNNSSIRYYTLLFFFLLSILQCLPVFLRVLQKPGNYERILIAEQRRELIKFQYRMRAAAPEDALLEQALDRVSLITEPAPPTFQPVSAVDRATDEIEDAALRSMQDMRAAASPDAGQTAD